MNVPLLDLQATDGSPASLHDLWQRKNLLLLFAEDGCERCDRLLADWQEHAEALRAENAEAVAVYAKPPSSPPPGTRVLIDPTGRFAREVGAGPGVALAADRFFHVRDREDIHQLNPERAAAETLDWIRLAERECPECGVGTW